MKLIPKDLKSIADSLSSKTNYEWEEIDVSLDGDTACVLLKDTKITVARTLTAVQIKTKIERYYMNLSQPGSFHILSCYIGGSSINGSFGGGYCVPNKNRL